MHDGPRNITQEAKAFAETPLKPSYMGIIKRKSFYFAAACAANSLVMVDYANTTYGLGAAALKSLATADSGAVLGVTEHAIVAGTWAEIVVYGPVYCLAHTDVAEGSPVMSHSTAGMVADYVEGTNGNRVGFGLEADAPYTNPELGTSINAARIFVQLGG